LGSTDDAGLLEVSNQIPRRDEGWDADMDEQSRHPTPEYTTEDDPIPEVFPEQDPKVDREWEEAKNDPMGGASPSS
jgi:hypothetical protein